MRDAINFGDTRLPDRFWSKAIPEPNGGCWLWIASLNNWGYGQYSSNGKPTRAYKASFEALIGQVDQGLELDHLCRVRCCVNPAHLEPVTHAENQRRGDTGKFSASKTHCPRGHAYDDANTLLGKRSKSGEWKPWRQCRSCHAEDSRLRRKRLRAHV